jgi:RNA recognition motif-containing protein
LIDGIDVPKDHKTGKNKGSAMIEYRSHKDAKIAVKSMNNFEVMPGLKLAVSIILDSQH